MKNKKRPSKFLDVFCYIKEKVMCLDVSCNFKADEHGRTLELWTSAELAHISLSGRTSNRRKVN